MIKLGLWRSAQVQKYEEHAEEFFEVLSCPQHYIFPSKFMYFLLGSTSTAVCYSNFCLGYE